MLRATVTGSVWATRRLDALPGGALLEVRTDDGATLIAFDVLGQRRRRARARRHRLGGVGLLQPGAPTARRADHRIARRDQRERSSDERSARHDRDEGLRGRAGRGRRDGEGGQRDDHLPRGGRRRARGGGRARRRRRGQGGHRGRLGDRVDGRRARLRRTSSRGRTTSWASTSPASPRDARADAGVELRVYLPIPDLGRQFAAYLGTPLRARGYPPIEGDHALIVEVAPGLAIERIIDLALKAVPEVEPGIHFVERQFGVLEVHARRPGARRARGRGDPRRHRRAAPRTRCARASSTWT